MHELAICQALITRLEEVATKNQASGVERVVLSVGPLSGVEPQLLERAFTVAQAGTVAANAELEIHCGTVHVTCRSCGADSEVAPNRLLCGACGDWQVKVTQGDELLLMSVELSMVEPNSKPESPVIPAVRSATGIQ